MASFQYVMFSAKSVLRAYDVGIRIGHEFSNTERLLKIYKYLNYNSCSCVCLYGDLKVRDQQSRWPSRGAVP